MRLLPILYFAAVVWADATRCACDPAKPETLQPRECSLCREAEKQTGAGTFYLKDINPRKPNRWLVLPKAHGRGSHPLHEMTPEARTELWTAAIAKAKELWGEEWGLAINGEEVKTQCHAHIHIGKLLRGIETDNFVAVDGPSKIPAPKDNTGLWVHPTADGKLHVHLGEQITETALLR